jgi:two-component system response regulator AtoC
MRFIVNFLIVEDDKKFSSFLAENLSKHGKVFTSSSYDEAAFLLEKQIFDCAILDLMIGDEIIGPRIAKLAKQKGIGHVIAMTHFENDDELIHEAYSNGVDDFVKKSNLQTHLEFFIKKFTNAKDLRKRISELTKTVYLTKDEDILRQIRSVCESYAMFEPIFVSGPSGVGKTLFVKCLKGLLKVEGQLINLNCAGMDDDLLKSELFGHEKGAFTGADRQKIGKIELANNGILFLDEVGDIPLPTQEKLLKVIDEFEFTRVGGTQKIISKFLLVSGTLKNLEKLVDEGKMRPDFYNRIKGKTIYLKPLKERKGDLKILIEHFKNSVPRSVYYTPDVKEGLLEYSWPGNIRELHKVIYQLSDVKSGIVQKKDLEEVLMNYANDSSENEIGEFLTSKQIDYAKATNSLQSLLDRVRDEFLQFAYAESEGNKAKISRDYQVSRKSLVTYYKNIEMSGMLQ